MEGLLMLKISSRDHHGGLKVSPLCFSSPFFGIPCLLPSPLAPAKQRAAIETLESEGQALHAPININSRQIAQLEGELDTIAELSASVAAKASARRFYRSERS
jgi:hypothetical protein